jgi:hypothetical protein
VNRGGGLGPHDVYKSYVEGPLFEGEEYPLEYDRMKHFEPIDEECQKYNEWEKIDRQQSLILNSSLEVSIEPEQVQAPEVTNRAAQASRGNQSSSNSSNQ